MLSAISYVWLLIQLRIHTSEITLIHKSLKIIVNETDWGLYNFFFFLIRLTQRILETHLCSISTHTQIQLDRAGILVISNSDLFVETEHRKIRKIKKQ